MGCGFLNQYDGILGLEGRTDAEFWQLGHSDTLSKQNRSILADFIVGVAVGVVGPKARPWAKGHIMAWSVLCPR